jgi:phenylalanyl-tRNA synthetase beta chain
LKTRNVFIECTATDLHKAEVVLDTIVTMFSEYCESKYHVECVEVTQLDGSKHMYPKLSERDEIIDCVEVNKKIGINVDDAKMATLLSKMGLTAKVIAPNKISVHIPPTRSDILHACDIIEDVAIGYGFNNIKKTIPQTNCFSSEVERLFVILGEFNLNKKF